MALSFPPIRKSGQHASTDRSHRASEEQYPAARGGVAWSDSEIRHNFYFRLMRGEFGNLKSHQVEGIQRIIDQARGADRELEPSKVLRVIHDLTQSRVDLGLDSGTLGNIVSSLSRGPEE